MERKKLIKELDKVVSVIVRGRDDRCATCGRKLPYNKRQAGHFIPRVVQKTRWDLNNVNAQCSKCNVDLGGNINKYNKYIIEKYGIEEFKRLTSVYQQYKNGKIKELSTDELSILLNDIKSKY